MKLTLRIKAGFPLGIFNFLNRYQIGMLKFYDAISFGFNILRSIGVNPFNWLHLYTIN